jgi:glycosyltransferase involved in cell wall biosynthesis
MLISIGLPAWNCGSTLRQAIESILCQTYQDWELLLIDDGSRDGTGDIARNFFLKDQRIRVFSDGKHLGISYRLNQAIARSRGELFARMDGDDVAYPDRFERQVAYLRAHPDVDLVGTGAMVFGSDGVAIGKRYAPEFHDEICARPYSSFPITHPTFMGRIELFRTHGYAIESVLLEDRELFGGTFRNGLKIMRGGFLLAQDQELLLRTYDRARFGNVPDILLGYREPNLRIRKQAIARYEVAKSLYHNLWKKGSFFPFLKYAPIQIIKLLVDCLAISTNLNHRLLKHRALPITQGELIRWDSLWREVTVRSVQLRFNESNGCISCQ